MKFKTMKDVKEDKRIGSKGINEEISKALKDTNRITKVGGFLRKYSLDEIP